jgi:hypothetical protein
MAQAPEYVRAYDFEDFQSSNPTTPLPADQIEAEYNNIKTTTDALRANLALIQRDDTKLANSSVHIDSLDTFVKSFVVSGQTFTIRGEWADMTVYAVGDVVTSDGTPYVAFVAHTSNGSIDTTKFSAFTAPIATPDNPGDDNKFLRATAGVGQWVDLLAAHLTDVPAGLQAVITAANTGAARTALGITATGDAVATAASAAAARTALGATTIGGTIFTAADAAAVIAALAVPALASANVFTADQTIRSAEAGATEGPLLTLDRNSASPLDNDLIGALEFVGRSDIPNTRVMAKILAQVLDVSDTEEDAIVALQTIVAGTLATRAFVGAGMVVGSPTNGDQGAGSINVETLFLNGVQFQADAIGAHAGVAKGWVHLSSSTTNLASHNVSGVANNGNGDYTVTWDTDFATGNYVVQVTTLDPTDTGAAIELGYIRESLLAGSTRIRTVQNDGGAFNNTETFVTAHGSQ